MENNYYNTVSNYIDRKVPSIGAAFFEGDKISDSKIEKLAEKAERAGYVVIKNIGSGYPKGFRAVLQIR